MPDIQEQMVYDSVDNRANEHGSEFTETEHQRTSTCDIEEQDVVYDNRANEYRYEYIETEHQRTSTCDIEEQDVVYDSVDDGGNEYGNEFTETKHAGFFSSLGESFEHAFYGLVMFIGVLYRTSMSDVEEQDVVYDSVDNRANEYGNEFIETEHQRASMSDVEEKDVIYDSVDDGGNENGNEFTETENKGFFSSLGESFEDAFYGLVMFIGAFAQLGVGKSVEVAIGMVSFVLVGFLSLFVIGIASAANRPVFLGVGVAGAATVVGYFIYVGVQKKRTISREMKLRLDLELERDLELETFSATFVR